MPLGCPLLMILLTLQQPHNRVLQLHSGLLYAFYSVMNIHPVIIVLSIINQIILSMGLFPYYIISYNKQGSFQMIIEDYNKGTKGCQKRLCIIENQKFARKCIYACI